MELIDTHAHLTYAGLVERVDDVLANARAAGVRHIISIASDAQDAQRCLDLARAYPGRISSTAGIHPHESGKVAEGDAARVRALLDKPEVVALGEVGLDYYYDFADRETQKRVLGMQLELACEVDKPLVVHCREAFDDTIDLLSRYGYRDRRVVFHCFTGSSDDAKRVAECGWRISFTGIVTFKKLTELQAIARDYPADQLMVETDSPYLSPVPVRHVKPNEPAHVAHTARFLAALRGVDVDVLAAETTANAEVFFGIKLQ